MPIFNRFTNLVKIAICFCNGKQGGFFGKEMIKGFLCIWIRTLISKDWSKGVAEREFFI